MSEHTEDFIETYTGKKFHFLKPRPEEICIRDIAHSLSLKCRYSGHCKEFYSVADHSLRVATILPNEFKLSGLLHDATEAYMPDVPRPIKKKFGLRKYEDTIWSIIADKYGVVQSKEIEYADDVLIATEARQLMENMDDWADLPPPIQGILIPLTPHQAELIFIQAFTRYGGIDK